MPAIAPKLSFAGHGRSGHLRWEIVGGHTEVVANGFMDREGAQRAMAVLDEQEDRALAAQTLAAIAMRRVEPEPVVPQPRHGDEQQKRRPQVEGSAVQGLSPR